MTDHDLREFLPAWTRKVLQVCFAVVIVTLCVAMWQSAKRIDRNFATLNAIQQDLNTAIVVVNAQGIVQEEGWNFGAERLFKRSAAEMIGRSIEEVMPYNSPHGNAFLKAMNAPALDVRTKVMRCVFKFSGEEKGVPLRIVIRKYETPAGRFASAVINRADEIDTITTPEALKQSKAVQAQSTSER